MTVKQLAHQIEELSPEQRSELYSLLGLHAVQDERRGGPNDPLSKLIGAFSGVEDGSVRYKEDLYGGDRPL